MKTKKFNNKLTLNKMTVANIGDKSMNAILGGATLYPCISVDRTRCITNCDWCDTNKPSICVC